jgi:hypothetical protein
MCINMPVSRWFDQVIKCAHDDKDIDTERERERERERDKYLL